MGMQTIWFLIFLIYLANTSSSKRELGNVNQGNDNQGNDNQGNDNQGNDNQGNDIVTTTFKLIPGMCPRHYGPLTQEETEMQKIIENLSINLLSPVFEFLDYETHAYAETRYDFTEDKTNNLKIKANKRSYLKNQIVEYYNYGVSESYHVEMGWVPKNIKQMATIELGYSSLHVYLYKNGKLQFQSEKDILLEYTSAIELYNNFDNVDSFFIRKLETDQYHNAEKIVAHFQWGSNPILVLDVVLKNHEKYIQVEIHRKLKDDQIIASLKCIENPAIYFPVPSIFVELEEDFNAVVFRFNLFDEDNCAIGYKVLYMDIDSFDVERDEDNKIKIENIKYKENDIDVSVLEDLYEDEETIGKIDLFCQKYMFT